MTSPFDDRAFLRSTEARITNLDNGKSVYVRLRVVELIERYGFYGGKESRERLGPEVILRVFDFP